MISEWSLLVYLKVKPLIKSISESVKAIISTNKKWVILASKIDQLFIEIDIITQIPSLPR